MVIDLSHIVSSEMPIYPGSPQPKIADLNLFDEHGVYVQFYEIEGHIGTHLDTPAHLFRNVETTATFSVDKFFGKARIVDCSDCGENGIIGRNYLNQIENLRDYQFVIFKTGWGTKWGSDGYFNGFPVLSSEVIEVLIDSNIFGIGLDTISIDRVENYELPNHKQWLSQNKIIIENVANLDEIEMDEFEFACFPIKFKNGDGSPVRAVAFK